jgi:hypothetical protein
MPACMIKLTPFARRYRSSAGGSPSMAEGVLAISASEKYHWLGSSDAISKAGDRIVSV